MTLGRYAPPDPSKYFADSAEQGYSPVVVTVVPIAVVLE